MAAATAVFQALAPGDHVIAPRVMYWALRAWLLDHAARWGLEVELVDTDRPRPSCRGHAAGPDTARSGWRRPPTRCGRSATSPPRPRSPTAPAPGWPSTSTVATPVLTRPLELGADLVMHAATKYLNGHSDVVAGTLTTRARDEFWERIRAVRAQQGGILGSFEAWLLLRGMRTLVPARAAELPLGAGAGRTIAPSHPQVAQVLYPGLPTFPGHDLAARQMRGGFGGMLSIRVRGGEAAAVATAARVRLGSAPPRWAGSRA